MQTSLEQLNVKNTNSDSFYYCLDIKGTFQIEYKVKLRQPLWHNALTKKVNASQSVNVKILTVSKG